MNILSYLASLFQSALVSIETKLAGAFVSIVTELPEDEAQILHDAINKFTEDMKGGKTFGESAAEALTVFFNEEKGEVNKVTHQLFQAFLSAVEQ